MSASLKGFSTIFRSLSDLQHRLSDFLRWRFSPGKFLRNWTPRGLYQRAVLIILLPIALTQTVVTYVFFDIYRYHAGNKLAESVAGDVAVFLELYQQSPDQFELYADTAYSSGKFSIMLFPGSELGSQTGDFSSFDRAVEQQLSRMIDLSFQINVEPEFTAIKIALPDNGGVIALTVDKDRFRVGGAKLFVFWIGGLSFILAFVAVVFIRYQIKPIEKLAMAADAFGRGLDLPGFKPSGAWEVQIAARSVIGMRNRIRRFAEQRTEMLAGVSHDLRTPLTRLRLELAMLDGVDISAANADIAEMEKMLEGYLAFARVGMDEEASIIDLKQMLEEISNVRTDANIELQAPLSVPMRLRPVLIRRAISNLVNNALVHGDRVRISLEASDMETRIMIDDDGPGIARDKRDEAFRPFIRLDPSRNQNVSGVGLGLTAARDAARIHGGDVTLSDSPLGGLRAIMRLPQRGQSLYLGGS